LNIISVSIGLVLFVSLLYVFVLSLKEKESRAAKISLPAAIAIPALYIAVGLIDFKYHDIAIIGLLCLTAITTVILFFPLNQSHKVLNDTPRTRIDERDTMFSRYYTPWESEKLAGYYRDNPDKKVLDDKFRAQPGLLEKGSKCYNPVMFSAANASLKTVAAFHASIEDGPAGPKSPGVSPRDITNFIKNWAIKLGAVSAGVTELKDYHLYSTIGRGELYGTPVELGHKYAIAVTVEMDKHMLAAAPYGPTVMESSQQYLACGAIAAQIAEMIRNLGYPARAHIDGKYRVVCPLVARDAGLGEIGRMGLLMTPQLGPRVRIAVVTTDLPLVCDDAKRNYSVIDFCTKCRKCALVCPSNAIPFGDMDSIEGVERWQINSEACFTIWCAYGTDCGRCVSACPYSHPDNFMHNFVRRCVHNSRLFRTFAIKMDDVLYGKNPPPAASPDWMPDSLGGEPHGAKDHIVRH
jgi:ferredoxin